MGLTDDLTKRLAWISTFVSGSAYITYAGAVGGLYRALRMSRAGINRSAAAILLYTGDLPILYHSIFLIDFP
jgi:hypothetical protein